MAGEERGVDRRRALGMIGKASAAAVVVGVPVAAAAGTAKSGSTRKPVDMVVARREFDAGAVSIPMEEILPDNATPQQLLQAKKLMEHRIGRVVELLLENQNNPEHLVTAKHSMHRARKEVKDIVTRVADGSLRTVEARAKARTAFEVFFNEMKALGAKA